MRRTEEYVLVWAFIIIVVACRYWKPKFKSSAYGCARWASDKILKAWGLLDGHGIVIGRTLTGKLICVPRFFAVLLVGGAGSGKGIGVICPTLLSYSRGSLVCWDTKGDLFRTTAARRRQMGHKVVRIAPFDDSAERFNPCDLVARDSPLLIEFSRSMAAGIVVESPGESEPHWNKKSADLLAGLLVLVLSRFQGAERNLLTVADLASDPELLYAAGENLKAMGGIPARMGAVILALFEKRGLLTKEGSGVQSTALRHCSFVNDPCVERSLKDSTIDARDLLKPGVTWFLEVPPRQLIACKGLITLWFSVLVKLIGAEGDENRNETLFLIDEASSLSGVSAYEEACVRGRSAGIRLLLAYQSISQVREAFHGKPTLIQDNCSVQLFMGGANSIDTAEMLTKSLGDFTQQLSSHGQSWTRSGGGQQQGEQWSHNRSVNLSEQGRNLARPEELLRLGSHRLVAMVQDVPDPILARRVSWFSDPAFNPNARRPWRVSWWAVYAVVSAAVFLVLGTRAWVRGEGYFWQGRPGDAPVWMKSLFKG